MCLAVSILVLAHNQLQSNSQLHKEQIFRAWRHARLATILCVWDTHTWHHRQAPNGVTDEPIICPSEDAYVSAPPRDTYGQRQVKDLQILTYTDKQHNHDSNTHTSRVLSYLQTLQHYYKEQHSVDATQNKEFSCHVLYSDINSSMSINRSQEQRSSIVQPSSLISHTTLFASNSPAKKHLIHFTKMAEKGSATHLITVYRAERQRRVRPLPRRGQIKLKIAHIVVHSIASALLRTFSQLQVLDQK